MGCCQNAGDYHYYTDHHELQPMPPSSLNNSTSQARGSYSQQQQPQQQQQVGLVPPATQSYDSHTSIMRSQEQIQPQQSAYATFEQDEGDMLRGTHMQQGAEVDVGLVRQKRMEDRVNSLMSQQVHQRPPNAAYPADSKIKFGGLSAINEQSSSIYVTNPHRNSSIRAGSMLRPINASQERVGSGVYDRSGSVINIEKSGSYIGSNANIHNERSDNSMIVINTSHSSIRQSHQR